MGQAALKRMTIAEFLAWNPPSDARHQLLDGVPVAMAPPAAAHGTVVTNIGRRVAEALDRRPPCRAQSEAGVALWDRDTWYQADLAVTCRPHEPGQQEIPDPVLIVEVLSPSTESHDLGPKLAAYRRLASVQEIMLVDSRRMLCHIHRRQPDGRWIADILQQPDERVILDSCGLDQPLAAFYANVALEGEGVA